MQALIIILSIYGAINIAIPLIGFFAYEEWHYSEWWNNGNTFFDNLNVFGHIFFHLLLLPYLLLGYIVLGIRWVLTYKKEEK